MNGKINVMKIFAKILLFFFGLVLGFGISVFIGETIIKKLNRVDPTVIIPFV